MITTENWNYAFYKNGRMQASLNLVGSPSKEGVQVSYTLSLFDDQNKEYFNYDFNHLEEAIEQINIRYAHWDFSLHEDKSDSSGCSSCQAH